MNSHDLKQQIYIFSIFKSKSDGEVQQGYSIQYDYHALLTDHDWISDL